MITARLLVGPVVAALLLVSAGCGGGGSEVGGQDPHAGVSAASDTEICLRDATAVTSTPEGYPASFPLPAGTVLFHVDDRGEDGVIATGVTATPFADVLAAMNASEKSGFAITSGETEEDDAEANWTGHGYVGRWAIKKSATCSGETVIQLLSKKN